MVELLKLSQEIGYDAVMQGHKDPLSPDPAIEVPDAVVVTTVDLNAYDALSSLREEVRT